MRRSAEPKTKNSLSSWRKWRLALLSWQGGRLGGRNNGAQTEAALAPMLRLGRMTDKVACGSPNRRPLPPAARCHLPAEQWPRTASKGASVPRALLFGLPPPFSSLRQRVARFADRPRVWRTARAYPGLRGAGPTGQIVHQLLVLLREFQQPSADARLRFHHRDVSEALDLLTVAGDPVAFRPSQPANIIPQHTLTPDLTNHGGKVRILRFCSDKRGGRESPSAEGINLS
jgi:hypothetical protein